MFILWICFVFHNVFTPLHQYTSVLNGKTNSTVARIASSLTPALSVVVDPSSAKERIDSYLAATYTKFSRTYITELINNGHVYVNNSKRKPSYRLREGDLVQIVANELQSNRSRGVNLKLDILYEDDYMMAINKAPGMIVHPGAGCPNETVANAVEFYISSKTNNADIVAASKTSSVEDRTTAILDSLHSSESFGNHIVHRLDKDSSGVLLVGKNKRITGALAQQFASREVVKYYLVVCVGNPGDTTIAKAIGRSLTDRKKMSVTGQGKAAVSHVVTLLFDGQLSVAMVRIDTGRTHQIRVHMKQRRTPVLGDDQYGSNKWNRQLIHGHKGADRKESSSHVRTQLHAYETHFTHPVTGERLSVRAPLPPDISTLINRIAMKNMLASNALPLFFFSPNRTEELQAVRKVTSSVAANPLRDSERMIESQQEILHRKLVGVVNKTSGFLQGNTDILYASLQKASDQYRQQHQEGRKTVGAHGYMGSQGFYVAEDAVRPTLDVMRDSSGNEVDLDEVWGEYEVDEGGRDGHRVNTGETSRDGGERRRRERSRRRDSSDDTDDEDDDSGYGEEDDDEEYVGGGGFIIEEEDQGEFESGREEEDFGITIEYDDDDEEDKRYNSEAAEETEDADASKDIDDEYSDDTDIVGDAEEDETDPDEEDDDWSVESIATARRASKQSSGSDYDDDGGYDEEGEEEEVNFNAVKHWR